MTDHAKAAAERLLKDGDEYDYAYWDGNKPPFDPDEDGVTVARALIDLRAENKRLKSDIAARDADIAAKAAAAVHDLVRQNIIGWSGNNYYAAFVKRAADIIAAAFTPSAEGETE